MEYGDQFISRGDVAFDGGANQGIYTTAFANYVGATGKVISIEPMKYAVDLIQKNCELNGLDNVEIANAGLSDEIGTARLDLSEGVGSASITNDYGGEDVIEIETTTIDTLVEQFSLDRVDFIKLDIEGAELKALYGAKNTIEKLKPTSISSTSVMLVMCLSRVNLNRSDSSICLTQIFSTCAGKHEAVQGKGIKHIKAIDRASRAAGA